MASKQAIEGKRINAFALNDADLTIIGIDTHHTKQGPEDDGTAHPLYQDKRIKRALDENYVRNVFVHGIKKALIVRKEGDRIVVVDGRQRLRWVREANLRRVKEGLEPWLVPVMLMKGDTAAAVGTMAMTNVVTVAMSTMEKAKEAMVYLDSVHGDEEAAAATFGVTIQSIRNWSQLVSLHPKVQRMVDDGALGAMAAAKLADFSAEEQVAEAERLVAAGATSVQDVARNVKAAKAAKNGDKEGDGENHWYKIPKKRQLNGIIEGHESGKFQDISPDVIKAFRFLSGSCGPTQIKGLSAALRATEPKPKAKPAGEDAEE